MHGIHDKLLHRLFFNFLKISHGMGGKGIGRDHLLYMLLRMSITVSVGASHAEEGIPQGACLGLMLQ